MPVLYSVLLGLDVLLAIGVIALVLLQHGKGADAGAAFGSGASGTVFGARGSGSFLTRATAVLAAGFFINSLALAYLASHQPRPESVVEKLVHEPPSSPEQATAPGDMPAQPLSSSAGADAGAGEGGSPAAAGAPEAGPDGGAQPGGGQIPEDVPQ